MKSKRGFFYIRNFFYKASLWEEPNSLFWLLFLFQWINCSLLKIFLLLLFSSYNMYLFLFDLFGACFGSWANTVDLLQIAYHSAWYQRYRLWDWQSMRFSFYVYILLGFWWFNIWDKPICGRSAPIAHQVFLSENQG